MFSEEGLSTPTAPEPSSSRGFLSSQHAASTIKKAQFEQSSYPTTSSAAAGGSPAYHRSTNLSSGGRPMSGTSNAMSGLVNSNQQQHGAGEVSTLRQENTNLRLRLVYLDEVMAKRGFNVDALEHEVELRISLEQLQGAKNAADEKILFLTTKLDREEEMNVQLQREVGTLRESQERMDLMAAELRELDGVRVELEENERKHKSSIQLNAAKEQELIEIVSLREKEISHWQNKVKETELSVKSLERLAEARWNEEMVALKEREDKLALRYEGEMLKLQQQLELKHVELEAHQRDAKELLQVIQEKDARIKTKMEENDLLDDEVTLLKNKMGGLEQEIQDATLKHKLQLAEKDERIKGEQHRLSEALKASESEEEIVQLYKFHFQALVERVKHCGTVQLLEPGGRVRSPIRQVHFDATLTSPSSASSAGKRSPLRSSIADAETFRPRVTSVAGQKTTDVLETAISDVLSHLRETFVHKREEEGRALQRQGQLFLMSMEENYSTICTKLRKLNTRVFEVSSTAQVLSRSAGRRFQLKSETIQKQKQRYSDLLSELENNQTKLRTAHQENFSLRSEVQTVKLEQERVNAAAFTQDLMTRSQKLARECTSQIEGDIKKAVRDIRDVFVNTNVLTLDFCDSIKRVAARASTEFSKLNNRKDDVDQDPPATIESLSFISQQLENIGHLLTTNLKQGDQNRDRLMHILAEWEKDLLTELQVFETRYYQLSRAKSKIGGGSGVGSPAKASSASSEAPTSPSSLVNSGAVSSSRKPSAPVVSIMKQSPIATGTTTATVDHPLALPDLSGPSAAAVDANLRLGGTYGGEHVESEGDEDLAETFGSLKPYGSMRKVKK